MILRPPSDTSVIYAVRAAMRRSRTESSQNSCTNDVRSCADLPTCRPLTLLGRFIPLPGFYRRIVGIYLVGTARNVAVVFDPFTEHGVAPELRPR